MRLLTARQVSERVSYSKMHISRLEKAGLFPKRVQIGPGRVAWVEEEVTAWCQAKVEERDAKQSAQAAAPGK